MLSFDEIDIKPRKENGFIGKEDKEISWLGQIRLREAELELSFDSFSTASDNLLSEEWLMLLSSYEKEVEYQADDPEKKNGIYRIKIKYWPEDEQELKEELETILKSYKGCRYKFSS